MRAKAACVPAVALLVALGTSTAALAYPQDKGGCDDSTIYWHFSNSHESWTNNQKTWVREAFNKLEDPRDYVGTGLVNTIETSSGAGIPVQLRSGTGLYGRFQCGVAGVGNYIFIDKDWVAGSSYSTADKQKFYYKVARHEMMHAMGAKHGGDRDSRDGQYPTAMSTCINWPTFYPTNTLIHDDKAYLGYLHSEAWKPPLTANLGFERGLTDYTSTLPSASWSIRDSGGDGGPKWVRWYSSSWEDEVRHRVRVLNGTGNWTYSALSSAKRPAAATVSTAKVLLQYRRVDLPNHPDYPQDCSWPHGIVNANGEGSAINSNWTTLAETAFETVYPTEESDWDWLVTPSANPPSAEAYDFRVVFRGRSHTAPNEFTWIGIDNLTVRRY